MNASLASLLGQEHLVSEIIFQMDQTRELWHLLSGPSGSGKSWVLRNLVDRWQNLKHPAIMLEGDRLQQSRPYFPYLHFLARNPSRLRLRRLAKKGLSETGRLVPVAGGLATLVMDTVLSHRERSQVAKGLFLSEAEHEILFHLQEISAEEPLLIAADDLQYWDKASLALLEYLSDVELQAIFPFLRQLRVLASVTKETSDNLAIFIRALPLKEWKLTYFPAAQLPDVLAAFGSPVSLTASDLSLVYSVSGGHLEIHKRIAEYLSEASIYDLKETKSAGFISFNDLMSRLLEERFKRFELDASSLIRLLEAAAVVGVRFSLEELRCLIEATDYRLLANVPHAEELQLLHRHEGGYAFAHEVIQRYFQDKAENHGAKLHEAFATCVSRLRPADYLTRAMHLQAAGLTTAANHLQFIAFLQAVRDGETPVLSLDDLCSSAGAGTIAACYRSLTEACQLYLNGDLAQAKRTLERMEDTVPPLLLVEKDYLLALCLKRSVNAAEVKFGKELLQSWVGLKATEAEQWFRIMSTLTMMHADSGDFSEAKLCERELVSYFGDRLHSDPFAASGLNRLRRRCSALHSAEIAVERCRKAADYFGPTEGNSPPRNPLQWYLALTNLSANLLMMADFREANDVARRALDVSREFRQARRRPEIPLNNLVVSALLNGDISATEASRMLRDALTVSRNAGEIAILANNMAAAKARSGELNEALEDLEAVARGARGEYNEYYMYFINSNLTGLRFLLSGGSGWADEWDKIAPPKIPEGDRIFLLRRHELQREAFYRRQTSYLEWDSYISTHYRAELGPTWSFYGRGFLFSDLQFWFEF
jgi:hypothetical protein